MKLLALFAAVLLTVNATTDKEQWEAFKQTHGRTYKSLLEERTRFGIFQSNLRKIEEHNAKYDKGEETYFLAVTRFADWTREEFRSMLKKQAQSKPVLNSTFVSFPENLEVPDTLDWTKNGAVLRVKDQGQCGSCWAFSAVGAMEGQNAIKKKVHTPLSEQQLLDCSGSYGNGNCEQGGDMLPAFKYTIDNGLEAESSYPYLARQTSCHANRAKAAFKMSKYVQVTPNEKELQKALASIGPMAIAVNADPLQIYGGGIISGNVCQGYYVRDHGVTLVGYGAASGQKYWKVKNSWGTGWGEGGYFRIAKDANDLCGVAGEPSYPVVK